ncbi:lysine histidine transporter-like 8 [Solanum pennellii]|uniref:Lysine histidine transporter-like 8 n=1 Tax=Solanum pennellii TaxID=28526 RepID=A0ABM1FCR0_SOLPN|nr:lysine histidine transporter-like 8 [Solanum pennellii]
MGDTEVSSERRRVGRSISSFSSFRIIPINDDDTPQSQRINFSPVDSLRSIDEKKDTNVDENDNDNDNDNENANVAEEIESWLPITESRKGNAYTAAFHLLSSGLGNLAFVLPFAFTSLGWSGGIVVFTVFFAWRVYAICLLVSLHEKADGTRYSRYIQLAVVAFGEKLGKILAIFPIVYLAGGTCVMSTITGGNTLQLFYKAICKNDQKCLDRSPSGAEWYLVFICLAILIALFSPNLDSLSWVSFVGSIMGVSYFTILWTLSISKGRLNGVSYNPSHNVTSNMERFRDVLNSIAIITMAFRGQNLILEIQGTLPLNHKHPTKTRMYKGVIASYSFVAMCEFPLAIGGFWAYGNMMPTSGILVAVAKYHQESTPKGLISTIYLMIVIQCLCSFQLFVMPVFDNLERIYVTKKHKACPRLVRSCIKVLYGGLAYFTAVAFPFLISLAKFIGGIALPLSLVYPCFMWILIKKPKRNGLMYWLNMFLGCLGTLISVVQVAGALWYLIVEKFDANFFNP